MTFLEATASGRPFRRPEWKHWLEWNSQTGLLFWDHGCSAEADLKQEWILADDWEIQGTSIAVTEEQVDEAWNYMLHTLTESPLTCFKKKLGFK